MLLVTALFISNAFVALAATPTVSNVTAKQRYPWNGMVDITCTVSGISGTTNNLEFAVAAVNTGNIHDISQFWVVKNGTNSTDRAVHANGTYHLVWDSKVNFGNQICSNMVMRVNVVRSRVQLWEDGPYWATTNIGADNPEDYGYYFWWGDTVGYKRENDKWIATDGSSSNFSFNSGNAPTYDKDVATLQREGWITADGVLAPEHDAAHVQWGGDWRMPTKQELSDLNSKCDWAWTTQNGVQGYRVKGKGTYASASIFLPCCGYGYGTSLTYASSDGYYWSSVPYSGILDSWSIHFYSSSLYTSSFRRLSGRSVRPVQGFESSVGTYTITYSPGANGSGAEQTATKTHNVALTLKSAIYTRDGYTQTGWATSDGGAKTYDLGAPYAANSAVTLYPFWAMESATDAHNKVQLWENGPYWATTNIGADNPEDYGYYFWWGDTVGYKRENDKWVASDGSSSNFSFGPSNIPTYSKNRASLQSEGWIAANSVLTLAHDAAYVHWGGNWRMPTKWELSDLNSNCDWTWTTQNGVEGYIVRGRNAYASASIFLPCAGYGAGTSLHHDGPRGNYWSSVPTTDGIYSYDYDFDIDYMDAWNLYFSSSTHDTSCYGDRRDGQSVRAVQGFTY